MSAEMVLVQRSDVREALDRLNPGGDTPGMARLRRLVAPLSVDKEELVEALAQLRHDEVERPGDCLLCRLWLKVPDYRLRPPHPEVG